MYYKFEELLNYSSTRESFYTLSPVEISTALKTLPKNLALKIIYCELAEMLVADKDKDKMSQVVSISSEYGVDISDPNDVEKNIQKYLDSDNDDFEKSIELFIKSASLEDGEVDTLSLCKEEYDILKDDFLQREKYELIGKMVII